jgi:class 3 adenylate cyclase
MPLKDELTARVGELAGKPWNITDGRVVPNADTGSLTFYNTGIRIDACVLYADIHKSTAMVDNLSDTHAGEIYKAFLYCAAKIVRSHSGEITAYDGDRIMAIYVGTDQADRAINTAFELNWAVSNIINPAFANVYPGLLAYTLKHTVGVDKGLLLAAKTGARNDSDIVWVGPAANHASKLNSFDGLDINYPTRISEAVWQDASLDRRYKNNEPMWEEIDPAWCEKVGVTYRRSSWHRNLV